MAKLTTDLQVSMPKTSIGKPSGSIEERLALFEEAIQRQREREASRPAEPATTDRGWTREDLYDRVRPR
jgi:hypothetical protein